MTSSWECKTCFGKIPSKTLFMMVRMMVHYLLFINGDISPIPAQSVQLSCREKTNQKLSIFNILDEKSYPIYILRETDRQTEMTLKIIETRPCHKSISPSITDGKMPSNLGQCVCHGWPFALYLYIKINP